MLNNYLIYRKRFGNARLFLRATKRCNFAHKNKNKAMRSFILLVILYLGLVAASFAGTIKGSIIDAKDASNLTGVIVILEKQNKTTVTDANGVFEFKDIPSGTYKLTIRYISYKTQTITVNVSDNTPSVLVKLVGEGNELKVVTLKSSKITHTEMAVISEVKKNSVTVSAVGAAQISKSMDRNAADVVKRIPGVTVQDDKFIMVRGLMDRYNSTWLNDAAAPSSEIDKKAFSFDIIPSGAIDRLLVFKTPSADLPADFAGGMVKVYTSSIPEKNGMTFGMQTSYRQNSTGTTINYNERSSTDFLGYDNGQRAIPAGTPAYLDKSNSHALEATKRFSNNWVVNQGTLGLDQRINFSVARVWKMKKMKVGTIGSVSYTKTGTNFSILRQDFDSLAYNFSYQDQVSNLRNAVNVMWNTGISFRNSRIEFKNLLSQTGRASVNVRKNNFIPQDSFSRELVYNMGYESIRNYMSELGGTHATKDGNTKYVWSLGFANMYRNMPDLMRITYRTPIQSIPFATAISTDGDESRNGGRIFSDLKENTYSFSHQFSKKFLVKKMSIDLALGNYIDFKDRLYNLRSFAYTIKPGATSVQLQKLGINDIFNLRNVGESASFVLNEKTRDYDTYSATNKLIASFINATVQVNPKLKIVAGLRNEIAEQALQASVNFNKINPSINTNFLLPSVNASYNFTEKQLIRLAYGKTLNRPEFREWAPIFFYDLDNRAGTYGSLYGNPIAGPNGQVLKIAQIENYDLRYEWYPSATEMVQIGAFYKTFQDPIQNIMLSTTNDLMFTFTNAQSAKAYGIEIDIRKNLDVLNKIVATSWWDKLSFIANASFIKSELNFGNTLSNMGIAPNYTTRLQGQSPYTFNTGLYYTNEEKVIRSSLLYNVAGPRISLIGLDRTASMIEMPFNSLDFSIDKTFKKRYILSFGVQNLLNSTMRFIYDTDFNNQFEYKNGGTDKIVREFKPGSYISLGLKVKI